MRVAVFEDLRAGELRPLTWFRPTFEVLCGHFSARQRLVETLGVTDWGVFCRPELAAVYKRQHPNAHVNDWAWLRSGETLLVHGQWLLEPEQLKRLDWQRPQTVEGNTVSAMIRPGNWPAGQPQNLGAWLDETIPSTDRHLGPGMMVRYPWDLIQHNSAQLTADFRSRPRGDSTSKTLSHVAILGSPDQVYVHPAAVVEPFVTFVCQDGPVWIDAGVRVQSFTRIEGPAYIGPRSQLMRTNLRAGCSFGPECRVGGEVEASILHGHVNKYHDGFLGHSYVCPWVNLGALTTNSDLKNDYTEVKVPLVGYPISTSSLKIGAVIGDHTKTGLGSLLNTGASVGPCCQILPGGELLPKHIPPFSRIWHGQLDDNLTVDQVIRTARAATARRNLELNEADESLIRTVAELSQHERQTALARARRHP